MQKVILHCDLNNFYASVECLYNPEIKDKPVAVCGSKDDRHGIVLAKNYIAKKYGIRTGEATWEAVKKCPDLTTVPPNYSLYLRVSNDIRNICNYYTDKIEPFGIDENWLDVTESTKLYGNGIFIANEIKERIKSEIGITASIGVSYNKIFSKLGSDLKKPDAITYISPENYKNIVWPLPICDLLYVGPQTWKKLARMGIITIGILANTPQSFLISKFGKWGQTLWNFANGFDETEVVKSDYVFSVKGIGNSLTSPYDLITYEDVKILIYILVESVATRLRLHNLKGRSIHVWIKDTNLKGIERQGTLKQPTYSFHTIAKKSMNILSAAWDFKAPIRALGVRVTNLITTDTNLQLSIFDTEEQKNTLLDSCIDKIRERYGKKSIQRALILKNKHLNSASFAANKVHPISFFKGTNI